jgi:DNA-binding NtrC family response regulator
VKRKETPLEVKNKLEKKGSILIVDDDPSIRKVLAAILEEKGYKVDTAETGKIAIQKTKTKFYNLALLDIRLPDMEGTELLTHMKQTTPPMIKIMVTGYPSIQNAVEALNKGANAFIIKPLNIDQALKIIEILLEKQRESLTMTQDKIAEFIETRAKQLEQEAITK